MRRKDQEYKFDEKIRRWQKKCGAMENQLAKAILVS